MRGSMKKRGADSWRLSVYKGINPETGKREYYQETVIGKKRAEARLNEIVAEIDKKEFVEPSDMTYGEFLVSRFLPAAKADISEGAYEDYFSITKNHILKDPIAKIALTKIEAQHIEEYKIKKLNSPRLDGKRDKDGNLIKISPKTVKNHLILIKASFVYACELRILKYNPAEYVKFPKVPKYKAKTWTQEEAARFLKFAYYDRFYFLILLSVFYSKRKGELRGLRKSDVDLNTLTASIYQKVRKNGYKASYGDLKTNSSECVLELEPWMVPLFEREFAERAAEKLAYGPGYNDNSLVFAGNTGNPVDEKTLARHFNQIIERAEVPKIRYHDLRHTCISILLKRGWSMKHVQVRGGWSDIRTPGNIYAHVTPEMQQDVNADMTKALKIKVSK